MAVFAPGSMAKGATARNGLQAGEDRAWQEKMWTAQRFAWVVMALFIVAALFGATGKGGPLASATARSPGASVDYPQITRWQSDEEISVTLPPSASGEVELLVSPEFARLFSIKSIMPEPSRSETTQSGHAFTFDVGGGPAEKTITLFVTAGRPVLGKPIALRVGHSKPAAMRVTVLP